MCIPNEKLAQINFQILKQNIRLGFLDKLDYIKHGHTRLLSAVSKSRYGASSSAVTTPPLEDMYCPICNNKSRKITISSLHCHKNQSLTHSKIIEKLVLSFNQRLVISFNENQENKLEVGNLSRKDLHWHHIGPRPLWSSDIQNPDKFECMKWGILHCFIAYDWRQLILCNQTHWGESIKLNE